MYTRSDIFAQLAQIGAPRESVVLMHSSLRLIGDVEGGAEGLLDALVAYFTEKGGIFAVPTHTWDNLGTDKITLDLTKNESNLGAFARVAMEDGRGVRSENPSHSVVVFGDKERALALVAGECDLPTPTAPDSFYGRLYAEDGYVLLAGVGQTKNTYLHAVDEILGTPNRMGGAPCTVTVRRKTGEILARSVTLFDYRGDHVEDISLRFEKLALPFRYHGCVRDGRLGDAPAMLCSARRMLAVMKRLYAACPFDPLADETPILPRYYAK